MADVDEVASPKLDIQVQFGSRIDWGLTALAAQ